MWCAFIIITSRLRSHQTAMRSRAPPRSHACVSVFLSLCLSSVAPHMISLSVCIPTTSSLSTDRLSFTATRKMNRTRSHLDDRSIVHSLRRVTNDDDTTHASDAQAHVSSQVLAGASSQVPRACSVVGVTQCRTIARSASPSSCCSVAACVDSLSSPLSQSPSCSHSGL